MRKLALLLLAAVAAVPLVLWLWPSRVDTGVLRPGPAPTRTATPTPIASKTPAARTLLLGVIGDFGRRGGEAPTMVGVLRDYARAHGTSGRFAGILTTGDNAYESGTVAEAAFARALLDPLLGAGTRLVASQGNHDVSTRGGAPGRAAFGMPSGYYTTTVGPVQVVVLDANRPNDPTQTRWLRATLAAPRTTAFRVAVFHQPAAACSLHQADAGVDRNWLPLLDKGVDLVLSGHNHTYERFVDAAGLPLVTTGGGGATIYPSLRGLCTGPATVQVLDAVLNVVVLQVEGDTLHLVALDASGRSLDQVTIRHR